MLKSIGKTKTLLASLAMAATGLLVPAPASANLQCDAIVEEECATNWQGMSYTSYEACLELEWIKRCSKFPAPPVPPYTRF